MEYKIGAANLELTDINIEKIKANIELNELEVNKYDISLELDNLNTQKCSIETILNNLTNQKSELDSTLSGIQKEKLVSENDRAIITKEYDRLRLMIEKKGYAKVRRINNATSIEMINDYTSTTRYRRQNESKTMLEFIHGGESGAVLGAWDFLSRHVEEDLLTTLFTSYRRGKFIDKLRGRFGGKNH